MVKHIGVGFINDIKHIVEQSRREAYTAVNQAMVSAYWQIGRRIVEEELCTKRIMNIRQAKIHGETIVAKPQNVAKSSFFYG